MVHPQAAFFFSQQHKNMNKLNFLLLTLSALMLLTSCSKESNNHAINKQVTEFTESLNIDKTEKNWKTKLSQPPQLIFEEDKQYIWHLATTEGNIEITFTPNESPVHVSSTIFLTQIGFYDDLIFHRVIPGFMAQGGDPLGTGRGNPGYQYDGCNGLINSDIFLAYIIQETEVKKCQRSKDYHLRLNNVVIMRS